MEYLFDLGFSLEDINNLTEELIKKGKKEKRGAFPTLLLHL